MKQRKTKRIVLICIAAVAILAIGAVVVQYIGLKPVFNVELGDPLPEVGTVARENDRYAQSYGTLPVGTHVIRIIHNGIPTPVLVRVRDTVAPTAVAQKQTIPYGTTLTPDKLITKIRDESIVKVTFSEPFDFDRIGVFPVLILLTDVWGNESAAGSEVTIVAVHETVSLEAGAPLPTADAFLLEGVSAEMQDELLPERMHHVGTYPVRFLLPNGQTAESKLVVSDTVPPKGDGTSIWIRPDDPISPEMLIVRAFDETDLTFSFVTEPDESLHHAQKITVRMTDEGGNTTDVESDLVISRVEPIAVEASDEPITPEMLHSTAEIVFLEPFVPKKVGIYTIPVTADGTEDFVVVTVKDTTPPRIEKRENVQLYTGHPVGADAVFLTEDYSTVETVWVLEPDWNTEGEQTVRVRATDAEGNSAEAEDTVILVTDTEPPVLYGVINRTAYVGEPIAYLAEVYAEDAVDGRTKVTVESSVETEKAGSYRVVYSSEDASGNRVSAVCTFKLVKTSVTEDEVRELAKKVLSEIVTEDMVTAEKLKAVFDYTRGHIHYVGSSDKTDWRKEAVRGFQTGRGDCFTYYSVSRALLDELGIEYMSVQRQGGRTRHYWTIVNIGTGWYHFDTTIAPRHKHKCFMWTNEQCKVKPYFWRYDHSKYPDIATKKFDYDEVVRLEKEGKLP